MGVTVEFENDRIRVLRSKLSGNERHPQASRHDRLIVYLTDGHVARLASGEKEVIRRKAGKVAWRNGSKHEIENLTDANHEVIVVEFKR